MSTTNYPMGTILASLYCDGTPRYYKVLKETNQKLKVHRLRHKFVKDATTGNITSDLPSILVYPPNSGTATFTKKKVISLLTGEYLHYAFHLNTIYIVHTGSQSEDLTAISLIQQNIIDSW